MDTGLKKLKENWEQVSRELQDPKKMRCTVLIGVAVLGLGLLYKPKSDQISHLRKEIRIEEKREKYIKEVELLRGKRESLLKRFPPGGTVNFWTEYLLSGVREANVKLRDFEPKYQKKKKAGDFLANEIKMEVEGSYENIIGFLIWLETNEWFMRVLRLRFEDSPGGVLAKLRLAILAEKPKKIAKEKKKKIERSNKAARKNSIDAKPGREAKQK